MACFLGYRLFRVLLVVYGFVGGALVTTLLLDSWQGWQGIAAAFAGGLIGAALLLAAYLAGVALLGAAIGAVLVHLFWPSLSADPRPWAIFAACLAGAVAAVLLRRYVIIVGTSFGGAWTAMVGGLALTGHRAAAAAAAGDVWQVYPMAPARGQLGFAIGWIGLGFASAIVQLASTARTRAGSGRAQQARDGKKSKKR